jgi:holin-like protein
VLFLKTILQAAFVFLICLLGEGIVHLFSLSFPSSVVSMILLFFLLLFRWVRQEQIQGFVRFLQQNMALLFVPAGVAIMENYSYLKGNVLPFLLVCVISTIVTFAVTAYTVQFTAALQRRRTKPQTNQKEDGVQ